MAKDVYAEIPVLENEKFILRKIDEEKDAKDLLKVYSDEKAVPLFNSDNCQGDFYCKTIEQVQSAIEFWKRSYQRKHFVRWSVMDKCSNEVIGTIELFNRNAEDYFDNCGLLRLDLRSDYETKDSIDSILGIIVPETKRLFGCDKIATKAIAIAKQRISVLEQMGFCLSEEVMMGRDGARFDSYYVLEV